MLKIWYRFVIWVLKIKIVNNTKKTGFYQKFLQAMDEVEYFICLFPNLWVLRVSGIVALKNVEKCKTHCSLPFTR